MAPFLGRLGSGGGTTAGFGFGRRKFAAAGAGWTRILNQSGSYPGNTTGSFPTSGYVELLIFAVAGGGAGGAGGDDDGGGGGGGGAGQFNGYPIPLSTPGPYSYSIPGGGAPANGIGAPGGSSSSLTLSSPGGIVFSLNGGSGAVSSSGNPTGNFAGVGASGNPYSSHPGGTGNVAQGRTVNNVPSGGTPGAYGGAGGGGAGVWTRTTLGNSGNSNTVNIAVTTFGGYPLATPFSVVGSSGGAGTERTAAGGSPTGSPVNPALGGPSGTYNGGGGAGGGVQFFGTGNSGYGAGGGGGAAQGGTTSGIGGAGYLAVYAR